MKYFFIFIGLIFSILSCQKENQNNVSEIKIGTDEQSLSEVSINKFSERKILLSGGDRKFLANIENSKIAQVFVHQDTLKVRGIFEGETFATIFSHDKKQRLKINVVPPEITVSQDNIKIFPSYDSRFVALSGGGDLVQMQVNDPDGVVKVKWNGNTGILEMRGIFEGEATIVLTDVKGKQRSLKVSVSPEGDINEVGLYGTYYRNYTTILNPKLVVNRANTYWVSVSTNPYGIVGYSEASTKVVAKITLLGAIQKGGNISAELSFEPFVTSYSVIKEGVYTLFVEDIKEEIIILRGKGFKIALPRE